MNRQARYDNSREGKRPLEAHSRRAGIAQKKRTKSHRHGRRKTRALSREVARTWN